MTNKEQALKFSQCKCENLETKTEYTVCIDCGFKRSLNKFRPKNNQKISKRDQLAK